MNTQNLVTRTTVIFVLLAVAGIGVAVSAQFITGTIQQIVMVGIGSAMFGAALTFFLIRILTLVEK